jgi:hypothetical protein
LSKFIEARREQGDAGLSQAGDGGLLPGEAREDGGQAGNESPPRSANQKIAALARKLEHKTSREGG